MIGNYKFWVTARVDPSAGSGQGASQVTVHAAAQYTDKGREASVAIPLSPEEAEQVIAGLQALLEAKLPELQLLATTGAAEALVVAAKRGELGGGK